MDWGIWIIESIWHLSSIPISWHNSTEHTSKLFCGLCAETWEQSSTRHRTNHNPDENPLRTSPETPRQHLVCLHLQSYHQSRHECVQCHIWRRAALLSWLMYPQGPEPCCSLPFFPPAVIIYCTKWESTKWEQCQNMAFSSHFHFNKIKTNAADMKAFLVEVRVRSF